MATVPSSQMPEAPEHRHHSLREWVQGKPFGHPTHAMFVHFPVAFYVGALGLDVASRAAHLPEAPLAATWLVLAAFAATLPSVVTGLVDWWGMKPGSRARRTANRHLTFQLTTAAFFVADEIVRWSDRAQPQAEPLWIVLGALGVAALAVGQYLGGVLVYQIGFRVYDKR